MNRLQAELQRLYLPQAGPDGRVRALLLELARPASWEALAKVWQGVQADLELPAPAIAVSGSDGLQLWFSLAEPVPTTEADAFLASLRRRYLGHIAPERLATTAAALPPIEAAPGHWSAFVAPDLASLFADEPWLDLPPGADAQAELLSRLQSTASEDWKRAVARLQPATATAAAGADGLEPRSFLLQIMNDPAIELALRIEAAKALLPFFEGPR
jgi:hypothetical protein